MTAFTQARRDRRASDGGGRSKVGKCIASGISGARRVHLPGLEDRAKYLHGQPSGLTPAANGVLLLSALSDAVICASERPLIRDAVICASERWLLLPRASVPLMCGSVKEKKGTPLNGRRWASERAPQTPLNVGNTPPASQGNPPVRDFLYQREVVDR